MSFKNKVVIVTGSGSGIGEAIALKMNNEGARVVLVGRTLEKLNAVAARCKDAFVIQADVTNDDDCKRMVNDTLLRFGQLDVLVNNAGTVPCGTLFDGKLLESYDITMKEKVRAVAHLTALAAPHLSKTNGNIVNISGIGSQSRPFIPSVIMIFTAEAAMEHFSRCAAAELAPHGVRVNVVCPGLVNTTMLKDLDTKTKESTSISAGGKMSEPEEIADLVLFIASDKAKSITGSNYVIDNGYLLK